MTGRSLLPVHRFVKHDIVACLVTLTVHRWVVSRTSDREVLLTPMAKSVPWGCPHWLSYVRFRRLLNEGTFVLIKVAAHSEFSVLGDMNIFFLLTVKCEYFAYIIVSYSVPVFAPLFVVIFLSNCPKPYIVTVRDLPFVEGFSVMQVTSDRDELWNVHQQQSTSLACACERSVTDSGHVDNVPQRRLLRHVIVSVLSTPSQGDIYTPHFGWQSPLGHTVQPFHLAVYELHSVEYCCF